uniref:DUF4283 domain-containing protein n=1 Tax=Cannabis sativa TaxID=3483 RepID=A0A803QDS1_CANSA
MAKTRATKQGKPRSQAKKKKKRGPQSSLDAKKTKLMDEVLRIEPILFSDEEDIRGEDQNTRKSILPGKTPSIVCYVLGANPPMSILDGFVRRVWKDKIDKVGMISYGVFLVLFKKIEDRDQGLELKYWGEQVLYKIISQVGVPVMLDSFTKAKEKLNYSRILIEVSLQQEFPEKIWFEDENGDDTVVYVNYEWKPTTCAHCKGVEETRAKKTSDEEGFLPPKKVWKEKVIGKQNVSVVAVANSFESLQRINENKQQNVDGNVEVTSILTKNIIKRMVDSHWENLQFPGMQILTIKLDRRERVKGIQQLAEDETRMKVEGEEYEIEDDEEAFMEGSIADLNQGK